MTRATGSVRFFTWNIGANSVAPRGAPRADFSAATRAGAFARIVRAADPDVLCLQEFTRGATYATALLDAIAPLPAGRHWRAYASLGNVLLSRHELGERSSRVFRSRTSQRSQVIARVTLPDSVSLAPIVVACTHFQAKAGSANAAFRQRQANALVSALRAYDAPRVVMGDLNAIDDPNVPLRTLLSLPLRDAMPRHNGVGPDTWTWRDDRSGFPARPLDFVLFTPDSLRVAWASVLNTTTLSDSMLVSTGLVRTDVIRDRARQTFDHLPVVVDLVPLRSPR